MITQAKGNLLDADVDALVNTVNTVGVMGKGLALQFKRAFPEMFNAYSAAAKRGDLALGRMHVWPVARLGGPRYIINFPTKGHWRSGSKLIDIERGLDDLARVIGELGISSIALPPLGCGNGGLEWDVVEPLIRSKLAALADVDVLLYPPTGAPPAAEMRSAGPAPEVTRGRAALIETLGRYAPYALGGASLIEVQKLMYFLQAAGEPLNLRFTAGHYGPYADSLRQVLQLLEGHYLSGFGDGSQRVAEAEPIVVLPGAVEAARSTLREHPETGDRIQQVLKLVEGFESGYSIELLATVHWIAVNSPEHANDVTSMIDGVHEWSPRKGRLFTADHIRMAWEALRDRGWLPAVVGV